MVENILSDALFHKFAELAFNRTGIHMHDGKKPLMQSRLAKVLRQRQLNSYKEYYDLLDKDRDGDLVMEFVNAVSTNTTYFFREEKHFEFLRKNWAPQMGNKSPIRVWCAASSSGEEPYSIAITLEDLFPKVRKEMVASDIDTNMLQTARQGIYSFDKIDKLPLVMKNKYFLKGKNNASGMVRVKKDLRQMIDFTRINLIEKFSFSTPWDLIFCRNVMIYFQNDTKRSIVERMFHYLNPGGYLLIGHSETLNGVTSMYEYVQPAIYRRPLK